MCWGLTVLRQPSPTEQKLAVLAQELKVQPLHKVQIWREVYGYRALMAHKYSVLE